MSGDKISGKVKWFNNAKGFGFINTEAKDGIDEKGDPIDIFAHYSAIDMEGYKTLKAGQSVDFVIVHAPKGLHAAKISATNASQAPAARSETQDTTTSA